MSVTPPTSTQPADGDRAAGQVDRNAAAVLQLEQVNKTYGRQPPVPALRGVSVTVNHGELVAIVGPSGSGKTTLLHVIGTLERPTSGTVRIDGADVAGLSDQQLAALRATRIGFVFQQFFLARTAPRTRRDQGTNPHPIPERSDPARARRRRRRSRRRRDRHHRLCHHQALGGRDPRRSVDRSA